MKSISELIGELMTSHMQQLNERLGQLAPGQSLCCHELQTKTREESGAWLVRLEQDTHILGPGDTCDERVPRTIYGPGPA